MIVINSDDVYQEIALRLRNIEIINQHSNIKCYNELFIYCEKDYNEHISALKNKNRDILNEYILEEVISKYNFNDKVKLKITEKVILLSILKLKYYDHRFIDYKSWIKKIFRTECLLEDKRIMSEIKRFLKTLN